jgi:ferredoxin
MVAVINKDKCTGCGTCMDICPSAAIELVNERAVVDVSACVDCETCVDECLESAIHME